MDLFVIMIISFHAMILTRNCSVDSVLVLFVGWRDQLKFKIKDVNHGVVSSEIHISRIRHPFVTRFCWSEWFSV